MYFNFKLFVLGHLDTLLRSLVIGRLVWFKDEAIIDEAKKRFEAHVSNKTLLPADLRSAVYKAVLTGGDESTYNTMLRVSIILSLSMNHPFYP